MKLDLGIHIVSSRAFRCSLSMAKRSFSKAANAVFGKVGGRASEEVIIQIIRTNCMPVLLYGLEACPLRKSDINSLNFVENRVLADRTNGRAYATVLRLSVCRRLSSVVCL